MKCVVCYVKGRACRYCGDLVCELPKCIISHYKRISRKPFSKSEYKACKKRTERPPMNHPENCLVCNVNKPVGRLENWTYKEGDQIVWGQVYDDARGRFDDGEVIHTSQIVNMDVANGHVRTLNSLYILGKRKQLDGVKL